MKPTLLIATLSLVLGSPTAFAKSELETLRSLCQEQKRQINELEEANERLRADGHATPTAPAKLAAVAKPVTPAASTSSYTVKAGDTVEKIARNVRMNPEKLAKFNGITTSSIIHPGQKLKVPGATAAATSQAAAVKNSSPKISGKTHKVASGETLFSISKKHGMTTEALVAANPEVKAASLRPGQVVSLGGDAPATTMISSPVHAKTPPAVEKTLSAPPAPITKAPPTRETPAVSSVTPAAPETPSAPAPAATPEKKIRPITIEGEMTYGEFAAKHGTNAERLNALNGLDLTTATVLAKGSELYVPAQP